jgi:hypothetical protein
LSKSNYLENQILNHQLGGPDYVRPATVYISLYNLAPTDAGGGTEVSGISYARVAVTNNATNWPAAVNGSKANGTIITFPIPGGSWGTILAFGIHDAPTGGNLLRYGTLNVSKTIDTGDEVTFPIGDLICTED